jgi:hypothetical protein
MSRGLVDHDSFLKLKPAAQETLLRQTLLLYLTALELTNRNPDDWEAEAFLAALDHLVARLPLQAYREVERMLLPAPQRPQPPVQPSYERGDTQSGGAQSGGALGGERRQAARRSTDILRVQAGPDGAHPLPREKLDRNGMRRRLLQLSAVQAPSLDKADARRSVLARTSSRHAAMAGADSHGD